MTSSLRLTGVWHNGTHQLTTAKLALVHILNLLTKVFGSCFQPCEKRCRGEDTAHRPQKEALFFIFSFNRSKIVVCYLGTYRE